jgi:putative ABC transport system permease protein
MTAYELAYVSLEAVAANKLRSALTILGVAIGSLAITLLISISIGVKAQITGVIEGLGSNLYVVLPGRQARATFVRSSQPTVNHLTLAHADLLQQQNSYRVTVSPVFNAPATISYGKSSRRGMLVMGVMPNFAPVRNWPVARGRFVQAGDGDLTRRVAVIGPSVEAALFAGDDPVGKSLTIAGERFQIIGVMGRKGQLFDIDLDNQVFVPLATAQRVFGASALSLLYVHVPQAADIPAAMAEAAQLLGRRLSPELFTVKSQGETLEALHTIATILTLMLGSIAGVSLVVGGIGIMNIMIVAVVERTREIGLRKALGARDGEILLQFLSGALLLALGGSGLGLLLAYGGAGVLAWGYPPFAVGIAPGAVGLALGVAAGVGAFFGVYPAVQAARLDPIAALRHE